MMTSAEKIQTADLTTLRVVRYPDPRLREIATPIESIDDSVRALAARMIEVMIAGAGVGLAAPQVGVTVRMFVAMPTGDPEVTAVYINPRIVSAEEMVDGEEGCLSFPDIHCRVKRYRTVVLEATDPHGQRFQETAHLLGARIFQHESDHLDGRLLVDRMGSVAKLQYRRVLKQLEEEFTEAP